MLTQQSALAKDKRTAQAVRITLHLQHRHFALIASVIAAMTSEDDRDCLARLMGSALRSSNPNFDYKRFLRACGIDP